MRSDRNPSRAVERAAQWLSSQGLGVLCGQATVLLLAIGSVVLSTTREGASASIAMDDLRAFFDPPSVVHLWLYLLVVVLTVYALNTTLATCQNVTRKWRAGIRAPRFYAPALIHVAFLLALLAHGVGGIAGAELDPAWVGPGWTSIDRGRTSIDRGRTSIDAGQEARVTGLQIESNRDGSVKQVRARLQLRDADGAARDTVVDYNGPLSRALGSDLMLLIQSQSVPTLQLARGADRCEVTVKRSCRLADLRVDFLYLHPALQAGRSPFSQLRVQRDGSSDTEVFPLEASESRRLADGSELSAEGLEVKPAILLRHRRAPGNPIALLASILLGLGLLLMWRRFIPRASAT